MQSGSVASMGSPETVFYGSVNIYEVGLDKPEVVRFAEKFRSFGWNFATPILSHKFLLNSLPDYSGNSTLSQTGPNENHQHEAEMLIKLENLHYTYLLDSPLSQQALVGVNFMVYPGSIHAVAGANGSGKSTLLQHINGILRPELGHVHVGDFILEDPQTPLLEVVRRVGLVFQNPETQFFEVFVGDEIAYGPKQLGMDDLRGRVRLAMEMVGLDFDVFKDRRLETLSGGEKRKVALASTLVLDQEIMMFDEPTAGMDPHSRDELMALFHTLRDKGKTIIIASHRMEELAEVADHLSLMHSGQVSYTGPIGYLISNTAAIKKAGLSAPFTVEIAHALIKRNWPIVAEQNYTAARLLSSIKDCLR
jgi:energy-coupling factor transport system ATP-binding protein